MKKIKLIAFIYFGLTIIEILCSYVTTATLSQVFWGIVFMWMCLGLVLIGYCTSNNIELRWKRRLRLELPHKIYYGSTILFVIAGIIIITKFYTGMGPITIVSNLVHGVSNYNCYQEYFNSMGIAQLSAKKIWIVLLNGCIELAIVMGVIRFFGVKKTVKEILLFSCLIGGKLYFGLARGTNFEVFQIVFLLTYILWTSKPDKKISPKLIVITCIAALGCGILLLYVIRLRGIEQDAIRIAGDITFDRQNYLVENFPEVSVLITSLAGYLGIGIFYLSHYIEKYFFSGLGYILPNLSILVGEGNYVEDEFLDSIAYIPDMVPMLHALGLVCSLMVFVLIGILIKRLEKEEGMVYRALEFYLVYELFSMPVSSFIGVSSASKISILILLILLFVGENKKKRREVENVNL